MGGSVDPTPCSSVKRGPNGSINQSVINGYGQCVGSVCPPLVINASLGLAGPLIFQNLTFNNSNTTTGLTTNIYQWGSLVSFNATFTVALASYNTVLNIGTISSGLVNALPSSPISLSVSGNPLSQWAPATGAQGQAILTTAGILQFIGYNGVISTGTYTVSGSYLAGTPLVCSACPPNPCNCPNYR